MSAEEDSRKEAPAPPPGVRSEPAGPLCDICGAEMEEIHCRLFCRNCGYTLDCSDL